MDFKEIYPCKNTKQESAQIQTTEKYKNRKQNKKTPSPTQDHRNE
jgi:hypothetical protein